MVFCENLSNGLNEKKTKQNKNANKLIRFWQNRCQKNVKVIPVTHGSLLSVLSSFSRPLVDKLYSNKNVEIIARLSKRLGSSVFPFVLFPVGAYKVSWIRAYKKASAVYITLLMKAISDSLKTTLQQLIT